MMILFTLVMVRVCLLVILAMSPYLLLLGFSSYLMFYMFLVYPLPFYLFSALQKIMMFSLSYIRLSLL